MAFFILLSFFSLPSGSLLILPEGVVVGIHLHGLLTNINKNSGKKIIFVPPPPGPLGAIFRFF